ncbi:hypothetical protein JMN32_05210 [Fulvivirga sp. 29W222]|uniref:Uncharacterized protein n=1 Tax=Fulvivirga marina TaxID=2494733 RepID=A0A937KAM0_9BACT|nr:hypothetical protein [Fulvivirga marina]MBL6445696.1 hypothetical protein [Fulvivirga marina]
MRLTFIGLVLLISSSYLFGQDTLRINEKQRRIQEYLEKYRYCQAGYYSCRGLGPLEGDSILYTSKSKDRIFELLKNEWLDEELELISINQLKEKLQKDIDFLKQIIGDTIKYPFAKEKRHEFEERLDSLSSIKDQPIKSNVYLMAHLNEIQKTLADQKVEDKIILISGSIKDARYLEVLKGALGDSLHYNQNAVRLALARMGDRPSLVDVLDRNRIELPYKPNNDKRGMYNPIRDYQERSPALLYLNTQESVLELSKWLSLTSSKYEVEAISHTGTYVPIANYAAEDLVNVILNPDFKKRFSSKYYSINSFNPSDLKFIKKWVQENYGKYKLDKNYLPLDWAGELSYE